MFGLLRERISDKTWLIWVMILSAALQLTNITRSSIWHDEGFSIRLIQFDYVEMIARTARDVHPPLYYLLLKPWTQVFGISELAVRSLSVVFMVAAIAVGFYLVRRLFDSTAARLGSLFMAVGPMIIRYGQEARMYGLAVFLLLAATYVLVRLFEDKKFQEKKWVIGYGLLAAAALYTHYYAVFVLPAHWVYALVKSYQQRAKPSFLSKTLTAVKSLPKRWWYANFLAGGLFLPWLPIAYRQFSQVQTGFWIPPVDYTTLLSTMVNFLVFREAEAVGPWLSTGLVILIPFLIVVIYRTYHRNANRRHKLLLLISFAALSPLIIYFLSLPPLQSIYTDRYFVLTVSGFYLLLGVIAAMPPVSKKRRVQQLLVGALLVTFLVGIGRVYTWGDFKMQTLMGEVNAEVTANDTIVSPELYTYFETWYYADRREQLKLVKPKHFNGYGNQSLVYDDEELLVEDISKVGASSQFVWIVGEPQAIAKLEIPSRWLLVEEKSAGYVKAEKYFTNYTDAKQSVTINQ